MGTLQTTIKLNDQFSDKLDKINRSIHSTTRAMSGLQKAQLSSTQLLRHEELKLAQIESKRAMQSERIASKIELQNKALEVQKMKYQSIDGQLRQWGSKLRNILTIYYAIRGVVQTIGAAVRMSDKMTMADARLNLVAGDNKKVKNQLEAKSFAAAQRSTTDYLEFTKAVSKMGILAGDKFANNDSIIRFVELMNKSFQISGAATSERNAAMLQITQAIASNRLQGDEFRSILENAPMVMEALTKSLGVGHDQLKKMAKEGEITADVLIKAMFDAGTKIEEMYKKLPMTWERHWAKLKNVYTLAFKPIQEQLNRLFNSKKFQSVIDGICTALIVLGKLAGWALGGLFDLIGWVVDKFVQFKNSMNPVAIIMKSLIAATVTYVAVSKTLAIVVSVCKAIKGAIMGINFAMSLNPIGLIIAAVVLLIALIYGAVAAVNHFAGTSYSVMGVVAAQFATMVATIYNGFVYMWNFIASIVEYFANVWKHPIYSVKKLFVNFATNLLDLCISISKGWGDTSNNFAKFMIDAINLVIKAWNKFVDILPETVVTKLGLGKGERVSANNISNVANKLEKTKANLQNLVGDKPDDYWEAPKKQYKNLADVSKEWYNKGESLGNKVGDNFDKLASKMDDLTKVTLDGQKLGADALNGMGDKLGDVGTNTGNTAKNTGDIAKNTGSTEDYSYLRNWAYQKGMGNSIGYNIKIEQNNRNNIGSNMDLNRVVDAVRDAIIEGIMVQAEGV